MSHTKLLTTSALAFFILAPSATPQAPGYAVPKTSWGAPDLGGFWSNESRTSMTRPRDAKSLVVTPAEEQELLAKNIYTLVEQDEAGPSDLSEDGSKELLADSNSNRGYNRFWMEPGQSFARVKGEIRSSWIVDPPSGQIPYKDRDGNSRRASRMNDYSGPEIRPLEERCLRGFTNGAGPVINNGMYNNNYQIVQTPDHVLLFAEMIFDARIIPIVEDRSKARHGPDVIEKWTGDSVGWYEGNTLVIETVNVSPKQTGFVSHNGKTIERFSRWSDDQIVYEFTVDDPTLYSQVWKGEMSFNKSDEPPFEYACHEGNYALPGILAGARKFESENRDHPQMQRVFGDLGVQ